MTWRELAPEQLYSLREPLIIDVRSPSEHSIEFIPNSINIPLLENDERAHVGTVYAGQGEIEARRLAVKIIAPKIPAIVDHILSLRRSGQTVVVHCWRGGLRSEAVSSFLSLVGIDCWRLTGGYKAWRQFLLAEFRADRFEFETVILQGQTGVGKTDVLLELERQRLAVVDLEALANHRGSVFGGVGLGEQPTQKNFEAALWTKLRDLPNKTVFLEAEGKKVGKLPVPDFLFKRMLGGKRVLITGSIDARVERIFREYSLKYGESFEVLEQAFARLEQLRERLGAKKIDEMKRLVLAGQGREAVKMLLVEYYDPMYDKQIARFSPYHLTVNGDDVHEAAREIANWNSALPASHQVGLLQ
jgi:tRNA 2-selenouridine synthase